MNRAVIKSVLWLLVLVGALAAPALAQTEAGTCAAVQGAVEVQHSGSWQAATVGTPVYVGDHVRTAGSSRVKVVFRDDSVLDIAPDSEVALETQQFDESARRYQSLMRLVKGKIRAWVSEYYHEARARYEIETATAVSGVRGTVFIMVYDKSRDVTEVVGIADEVEVGAKIGVVGRGVQIGPHFYTEVKRGKFPTAPQRLDDARFEQFLEGLELVGTGRRDGLNVLHPAVMGRVLVPGDVPGAAAKGPAGATTAAAEGLVLGAPAGFLADTRSPDVYTNTQPLLDFRNTPPGSIPPYLVGVGGVKVGF